MRSLAFFAGVVILCSSAACEIGLPAGGEPHRELNFLDMADQPKHKPQRADLLEQMPNGMLEPPAGAIAVADEPYPFAQDQGEMAAVRVNPLDATPERIAKGKWTYENVCITCHGAEAAGDGHVTALFPKPPSLMTQKIRDWTDGRMFHVPMRGQGSMPTQASVVSQEEIWAVVLYIRSLQDRLPVAPPADAEAPTPTPTDETPTETGEDAPQKESATPDGAPDPQGGQP